MPSTIKAIDYQGRCRTGMERARAAKDENDKTRAVALFSDYIEKGWTIGPHTMYGDVATRKRLEKEYNYLRMHAPTGNDRHPQTIRYLELKGILAGKIEKRHLLLRHPTTNDVLSITAAECRHLSAVYPNSVRE